MSAAGSAIKFIRKGGRIIPIRAGMSANKLAQVKRKEVAISAAKGVLGAVGTTLKKPKDIQPNNLMRAGAIGVSVGSGFLQGLSFGRGTKGFIAGHAFGFGADVGATAMTVGAWRGKGNFRQRAKGAARDEAINQVAGHGVYLGTILLRPEGRKKIMEYAGKAYNLGKRAVNSKVGQAAASAARKTMRYATFG